MIGIWILAGLASSFASGFVSKSEMILGLGEQRILYIEGLKRFSLGSSLIKAVRLPQDLNDQKNTLLLKTAGLGTTDLWIWKSDGSTEHWPIRIVKWAEKTEFPPGLSRALSTLQHLEVQSTADGAWVRGEIRNLDEAKRLENLRQAYPKHVISEAIPSRQLFEDGRARLVSWIADHPDRRHLRMEIMENEIWLRGTIESPHHREAVARKARLLYPLVRTELGSADDAPTVLIRAFLLEVSRSELQTLGLAWPGELPAGLHVSPSILRTQLDFDIALQALSTQGNAKVLSRPELTVRIPGDAELFSGGELPIRHRTRSEQRVDWKPYGLLLKLKSHHVSGHRVKLEFKTEVSELDATLSHDDIPNIKTNRMSTIVDAEFGRPLLLCGLVHERSHSSETGLPILAHLPLLGPLFGKHASQNIQSELVVVLVPSLKIPQNIHPDLRSYFPQGYAPPPRNWIAPDEIARLKRSLDYPWNALR